MSENDPNTPSTVARDRNSGRFTETYPSKDFVEAVRQEGGEAGTTAIADRIGCSYETAYKKLRMLEGAADLGYRRVGNAYLWVIEDE